MKKNLATILVFLFFPLFSSNKSSFSTFISENKEAAVLTGIGTVFLGVAGLFKRFTSPLLKKYLFPGASAFGVTLFGGGLAKFWYDCKKNNSNFLQPKLEEIKIEESKVSIISITFFVDDEYERSIFELLMEKSIVKIQNYLYGNGNFDEFNNFDLWVFKLLKNEFNNQKGPKAREIRFSPMPTSARSTKSISQYSAYAYGLLIASNNKIFSESMKQGEAIDLKNREDEKIEGKDKYTLYASDREYFFINYSQASKQDSVVCVSSGVDISDAVKGISSELNKDLITQQPTRLNKFDGVEFKKLPSIFFTPEAIKNLLKI